MEEVKKPCPTCQKKMSCRFASDSVSYCDEWLKEIEDIRTQVTAGTDITLPTGTRGSALSSKFVND
jgi:hypothetical protein